MVRRRPQRRLNDSDIKRSRREWLEFDAARLAEPRRSMQTFLSCGALTAASPVPPRFEIAYAGCIRARSRTLAHRATAMSVTQLAAALADRYQIERKLAAGGMATVYVARDVKHARRVAIKVLHPELSAVLGADRFLAEIQTTAKLQ